MHVSISLYVLLLSCIVLYFPMICFLQLPQNNKHRFLDVPGMCGEGFRNVVGDLGRGCWDMFGILFGGCEGCLGSCKEDIGG